MLKILSIIMSKFCKFIIVKFFNSVNPASNACSNADCLGFNDRWLRIIGVPVVAFIIPPLFFWKNSLQWQFFFHSFIYTLVLWEGTRLIFIRVTRRYPNLSDWRKRLKWILMLAIVFTAVSCSIVGVILNAIPNLGEHNPMPKPLAAYGASYIMLAMVGAIYESMRFFNLWKKVLVEKEQIERAHLSSQLEGLRNQVNPHFLFNSLNTLIYLIPEDTNKAVRFVQQLSKVYRYVLESRDNGLIPLREELEFLHAYIYLQHERFGDNLQVAIRIPDTRQNAAIVPLSLQMLFENAIKHNIISTEKPLRIEVFTENDHLVVRNNLQRKNQVMDSTGVGLQNIRDRYRMLVDKDVEVIVSQQFYTVLLPLAHSEN